RNSVGVLPVVFSISFFESIISFRTCSALTLFKSACVIEWFAISCPLSATFLAKSGLACTLLPNIKNVAFASYWSNVSKILFVDPGIGPLSIVYDIYLFSSFYSYFFYSFFSLYILYILLWLVQFLIPFHLL